MLDMLIIPVMGGIIGYITNDIAIKMLFHPKRAIYIGKWKLPFTPGLIPKEKHRIAKSMGSVVNSRLLDEDTLKRVFTSEEMMGRIEKAIERFVADNRTNTDTVETVLQRLMPDGAMRVDDLKTAVAELVQKELTAMHLGDSAAQYALEHIKHKINAFTLGIASHFIDDVLFSLSEYAADAIDRAVCEHSEKLVPELIGGKVDKVKNLTIGEIIEKYEDKLPYVTKLILNAYENWVGENLGKALKGINIAKIVEDKIDSFDADEVEEVIFGVMRKELKAIVYLGALLGYILGWVNVLINCMV